MADQMTCPSCQAVLRYPPGAQMLRCPQCKKQIRVPAAEKPVPKAIPLPPEPAPAAIPLPFNKPSIPVAKPVDVPIAKAIPVDKPVARGKVVREEEPVEEPRRRKSRRREYEEALKEHKDYEVVAGHCLMARIGIRLMGAAALLATAKCLIFSMFLATIAVSSFAEKSLLSVSVFLIGCYSVTLIAGYALCCAGPKGMRGIAAIGIGVTLIHTIILFFVIRNGYRQFDEVNFDSDSDVKITEFVYTIASSLNNLAALTDQPWLLGTGHMHEKWFYARLMYVGGCCEFLQIVILGTIVQFYAAQGKSVELGFRSLRFVYRTIIVGFVFAVLKVAVLIFMVFFALSGSMRAELFAGEASVPPDFRIPMTLLTIGYFLFWAFAWYLQFRSMQDTVDIVTPARFLDKRLTLEEF